MDKPQKENAKMTLQEAIDALDGMDGMAAKRLSMSGYVYRREVAAADPEAVPSFDVAFVCADGKELRFRVERGSKTVVEADEFKADAAFLTNAIFATDWRLAPKAELEEARAGAGIW